MIKRKFFQKVFITSAVLFSFLLMCFIPKRDTLKVKQELNYVNNDLIKTSVYLLDSYKLLGKTQVVVSSDSVKVKAKEALEALIKGKAENKLPSGFQGIIPSDTNIKSIVYKNNQIKVDFSKELLDVSLEYEEKMIEAIVYTLTSIDNIKHVIIYVEGKVLTKLPKTGIILPSILDRKFGINKEYDIETYKDVTSYTVYYLSGHDGETYYVPVTKYTNSKKEKVNLIIDDLKEGSTKDNLISYLNYDTKLLDFENKKEISVLTFNESILSNTSTKKIEDEVIKSISFSLAETYQIKEVLFKSGQQEICKTVMKTLE